MECPHPESAVVDSRKRPDGSTKRRRQCLNCRARWSTIEQEVGRALAPKPTRQILARLAIVLDAKGVLRLESGDAA